MTLPSLTFPRRHAQLGRYAVWQFRDFAINIAILMVILFAMLGWIQIMQLHVQETVAAMRHNRQGLPLGVPLATKLNQFLSIYGMFSIVAPIVAVSSVVGHDRTSGYTRFLFSKPLSVRVYYAQSLFVRFVGFLAVGQILVLAYSYFEPPTYTPRFLVEMSVSFLAIGGVVFLLSVVSRYDGILAIVFFLLATVVRSHWDTPNGAVTRRIGHALTYLFPPIDQSDQLRRWLLGLSPMGELVQPDFPWKLVAWNGGYGLACLVLGLYLLRRIPLTKA